MTAPEEIRWFVDQLRAQTRTTVGRPAQLAPGEVERITELALADADATGDEQTRRYVQERLRRNGGIYADGGVEAMADYLFSRKQLHIEDAAAEWTHDDPRGRRRSHVLAMPTGRLSATTYPVPDSSTWHVVQLAGDLTTMGSAVADLVAGVIAVDAPPRAPDTDRFAGVDQVRARVESDPDIARRFADFVLAYAVTGRVVLPPGRPEPSDAAQRLALDLSFGLEYFVLGHEFSHVILDHLVRGEPSDDAPPADTRFGTFSWRQELDADIHGLLLAFRAAGRRTGVATATTFVAAGMFLSVLDVMDRAVALLLTGDENALQIGSHPPTDLRREALRDRLAENVQVGRPAVAVESAQAELFRLLWTRMRPTLLELHRYGVTPAASWRTVDRE